MNWIKFKNVALVILTSLHLLILFLSYSVEPGSKAAMLASLITLLLIIPIIINVTFNKMRTLAVNTSFILIFLIVMEGLFTFRIINHPVIFTWKLTASKNIDAVDFLDESPFVKFKPNVNVRSQGSRGDDFTYKWQTDALGFKNILHTKISNLRFDYIALGDSFTEGMGVAIEDTWTSKVNLKSAFTIYNAGVQGYSASQMKATYENLMGKITHQGIIIGALPTIFSREKIFSSYLTASLGAGGIRSIATGEAPLNSFLTTLIRAIEDSSLSKNLSLAIGNNTSDRYKSEIPVSYQTRTALEQNVNWRNYVENLIELSNLAILNGKKVFLIQYPHRHEIYFNEQELGIHEFKEIDYYVELDLLKESLPQNVEILDMFPYIKKFWRANKRNIYFLQDGHMNEKGQELIANFIIDGVDKY